MCIHKVTVKGNAIPVQVIYVLAGVNLQFGKLKMRIMHIAPFQKGVMY